MRSSMQSRELLLLDCSPCDLREDVAICVSVNISTSQTAALSMNAACLFLFCGHSGATQENPPFNLLRRAVRNPSQCLHMLISDARQPVALFLSRSVRDRPVSIARHEMSDSKTPTRFAKVILRAARLEKGVPKNAERIRGRHAAITDNFNTWRSYKSWAEKIRGTWEEKK